MSTLQRRIRRRQAIESLCAATLRALSNDATLQYRGCRLIAGRRVARLAPHLRMTDAHDLAAWRGAADAMALRQLYSDPDLHRSLEPESPVAQLIFDWLEQLRVESLAPAHWPGLSGNVTRRFLDWSQAFHDAHHAEGEIGELVYAVILACWSALTGHPILEASERAIEVRRGEISPLIGHAVTGMRRNRYDQALFAEHALAIVAFIIGHAPADLGQRAGSDDDDSDRAAFSLLLDFDEGKTAGFDTALFGDSAVFAQTEGRYRIFTAAYDTEMPVAKLVRRAKLAELRRELDTAVAELPVNLRRLARYFQLRLAVPERSTWRFGEEAGYVDGRRLAQIVSSPTERHVFKIEDDTPRSDALIGVLVDCSGSMKVHAEFIALIIDRLAGALTLAGVDSELLGFTTGAWSGGRAQADWLAAGRPANPGRLNELRHIVLKSADRPWRRARSGIAALLKPDMYREGVDGEALDWACARMARRDARRRILMVISDGSPMDSATQLANDRFYLDNHLRQTVARREAEGQVELRGLGVGLDLSPFYPRSLIVDPEAPIDNAMMGEIARLIADTDAERCVLAE